MLRMWVLRAAFLMGIGPEALARRWRHEPAS